MVNIVSESAPNMCATTNCQLYADFDQFNACRHKVNSREKGQTCGKSEECKGELACCGDLKHRRMGMGRCVDGLRDYLGIKFCKNECKGGVLCPPGTCDICPDVKKKDGEGCCFDSQCDTGLICSNTYKCTAGYDNGVDWREKDGIVIGQIGETPEYAVNQAKKYKSDNTWKNAMCNLGLGEAAKENLVFKSVNSFKQALTDISVNKAGGGYNVRVTIHHQVYVYLIHIMVDMVLGCNVQ